MDVEASVNEVLLFGNQYETAFGGFVGDIDSGGCEVGQESGHHGTGVEVEAPVVIVEFAADGAGEGGQMQRRRSLIDQALMAGKGFHGDGMIVTFRVSFGTPPGGLP